MAPTPNAATPPRRQSCNRCHGQKLRCTRPNKSGIGACNRCLRQGAQCVYSSSLPKGRPSMYRLADASTATSNPPQMPLIPGTPVSPEMHRQLPTEPVTVANANATNINAVNSNTNTDNGIDGRENTDANINTNANPNGDIRDINDDTTMFGSLDASPWPWLAPLSWSDMLVDGSDQDSRFHSIIDPQTDPSVVFSGNFPNFVGSASSQNSDGGSSAQGRPVSPTHHGQYSGSDVFDMRSNSSTDVDKNNPEFGIAELSQLSTRLYPLYRSSCNLAEAAESSSQLWDQDHARRSPLIDDSAFKSVTGWLVHVSANMNFLFSENLQNVSPEATTTGDTLHNAFAASHHLLEILRGLHVDVKNGVPYHTTTSSASAEAGVNVDFWASNTPKSLASTTGERPSHFEQNNNGSSNYARPPSQCYNTVVRHLVIACHTLLLNIHVAVLIAIQHDADLRSSFLPPRNVEDNAYIDATALADIRLVLVLRLCSYLIKRQQQAVDSYLSPQPSPRSTKVNDPPISQQSNMDAPGTADREMMSDLEIGVQQRLERLRQTLRI